MNNTHQRRFYCFMVSCVETFQDSLRYTVNVLKSDIYNVFVIENTTWLYAAEEYTQNDYLWTGSIDHSKQFTTIAGNGEMAKN